MNLEQYAAKRKMQETMVTVAIVTALTLAPIAMFVALLLHGAAIAGK
jgi:hypothetical protein